MEDGFGCLVNLDAIHPATLIFFCSFSASDRLASIFRNSQFGILSKPLRGQTGILETCVGVQRGDV